MSEPAYGAQPTTRGAAARGDRGGSPVAHPRPGPAIDSRMDGDRVVVAVRGELDLDAGQTFQRALREALGRSVRGIDLDLSGVGFCDCSALNILISLRHRALAQGKTIVVCATSPVSERLLHLTGMLPLFGADGPRRTGPGRPGAPGGPGNPGVPPSRDGATG
ncbi:STAS domain-containing protein [Streptomyces sp. NPDC020801]|uniref:STAS domain-containing protein n=1 Tax=unclassified Streptomyces TaxID=2593676 RepID=UPI00378F03A0